MGSEMCIRDRVYFGLYTAFLVVSATNPESATGFGRTALFIVVPLTIFALGFSFWDGRRSAGPRGNHG